MDDREEKSNSDRDPTLGDFEESLRELAIGTPPRSRDRILYECGYAAGQAEHKHVQNRSISGWRAFSFVASIAASVAFALLLAMQSGKVERAAVEQQKAVEETVKKDAWTNLAFDVERPRWRMSPSHTTVADMHRTESDRKVSKKRSTAIGPTGTVLQPNDFISLLNGDV